jgi:integrase
MSHNTVTAAAPGAPPLRLDETTGLPWQVDARGAPKAENRSRTLDPFAVAAIRLLILTGARLREILDAQWQHVDLERGVIFLPDSKTGRKPVYLSAAAQSVLASLPRVNGNPHIIPGERESAPKADLKKPWAAVTKAASLDGVRLHDLRHSFASIGAGAAWSLSGRDHTSLRASRCRPAAARGRDNRHDNFSRHGWQKG